MRRILNQVYDSSFLGGFAHCAKDAWRGFPRAKQFQDRVEEIALRAETSGEQLLSTAVLEQLHIKYVIDGDISNVPQEGPLLVLSNHPDALLDTVIFTAFLEKLRRDYKIIGDKQNLVHPIIAKRLFAVDAMGTVDEIKKRHRANGHVMGEAKQFLAEGGCLGFFPSMGKAEPTGPKGAMIDQEWHPRAARFIMDTDAAFLPIRIEMRMPRIIRAMERLAAARSSDKLKGAAKLLNAARKCHSTITIRAERAYTLADLPEANRARKSLISFLHEKANTPVGARK